MSDSNAPIGPNMTGLERAKLDRHFAFTNHPEAFFPILLPPCKVKILMVIDGGGSYTDHDDFGLGELIKALQVNPGPWVSLEIAHKAHRRNATGSGADILNFRFDQHDLTQYDQIWLFGLESGLGGLADTEIRAISQFMNSGGGVFATGDHEDLGVDMCGRVPRVRSMRKWYFQNPLPPGEPKAPSVGGVDRNDTNVARVGPLVFDNQSDDVPQVIQPRMYGPVGAQFPHPLFSGPQGTITVLPDHPHEGDCLEPLDLTAVLQFAGLAVEEYPELFPGTRLAPEVVAYSPNGAGITDHGKGAAPGPRLIGAVGAYDGQLVNVGRVVVHSTWHHFFNINIHGALTPEHPDPVYKKGFYYSPQGLAAYEQIKSHYRNIAVYLAPPIVQECMMAKALWATRWNSRIVMEIKPVPDGRLDSVSATELTRVGIIARAVLKSLSSQSQALKWIEACTPGRVRPVVDDFYGSLSAATEFAGAQIALAAARMVADTMLGAVVYQLGIEFPTPTDESRNKARGMNLGSALRRAAKIGLAKAADRLKGANDTLQRYVSDLETRTRPVSFGGDILPLFRQIDIQHMAQRGVYLDQYSYMSDAAGDATYPDHAHARSVYCYLTGDCTPRMPPGGPYWTVQQLQLYNQWMSDGFQP